MTRRGTTLLKILILACAGTLGGAAYANLYYAVLPTDAPAIIPTTDTVLFQILVMALLALYWVALSIVGYKLAFGLFIKE
jgi:hypothetical protein